MTYEIVGTPLPVVTCTLQAGEKMITESGAMSWMSPNMLMETSTNGGIGKAFGRMFSGESMFQNIYTAQGGQGIIAFASSFPGSIIPFEITPTNSIVVQKKGFLAAEAGVQLSIFFQQRLGSGFFGGEGFIMQKLSGQGMAFAEIDGITFHDAPSPDFDANFWLCTALIDEQAHVHGEDNAYAEAVQGAVGGAAGVVHGGGSVHTDCEPNRNVEALRMYLDQAGIESRPLWKPMHKQPVFKNCPAYLNGVSEAMFHQGICLPSGPMVTDEDVTLIIRTIQQAFK